MFQQPVYDPPLKEHQLCSIRGTISVPAPEYQDGMVLVNLLVGPDNDPEKYKLRCAINFLQALELPPDLLYLARLYWRHPAVQDYVTLTCLQPCVEVADGADKYTSQLENKLKKINLPNGALETAKRIVETLNVKQYPDAQSAEQYERIIIASVTVLEKILKEKKIPIGSLHEAGDTVLELDLPAILEARLQL